MRSRPNIRQITLPHLLADGWRVCHFVGQEDRLDAPAWNWRAGDTFARLHRFTVKKDLPPGDYPLLIGVYQCDTFKRLTVYTGGRIADDPILLGSVRVIGGR